jgi:predicted enzyme related to lactoylglutathione lyase
MNKRVTGLGGIFFKSENPTALREWYRKHLGIESESYGHSFFWKDSIGDDPNAYSVWSPFKKDTTYFAPSTKEFMINFRVENLHELLAALRMEGVTVMDAVEESEFGKFGWALDIDGNKIELWEPPKS